ncbi:hypothetical protein PVAG01_06345 [Phlyctema vagabunda]|uniref:DUF3752 domain-containing protein n=1 Tax=Phlyctema vagabunda TaxID=108571 RepID=A0ABR4PFX6_9HELO
MSSVGPQLPPHLMKRKRSVDDDDTPNSPPHKLQAAEEPQPARRVGPTLPPSTTEGEISISSDEEDDYGPSVGPSKPSTAPAKEAVGPALPSTTTSTTVEGEIALSSDEEDDYGPSVGPSAPKAATAPAPTKRVLGPAPPPANLAERPSAPADSASSDDDDDYGPSLPPAPGSAAETRMLQQRAVDEARTASSASTTSRPQRDDWMLVPPSDSDWTSRIDPTKLKSRKFASGKGAKAPADKSGGISAIWTETPEEKRQRLEDEVLGRKDAATSSRRAPDNEGPGMDKEERATERRIREYNERNRSKSLYDEHKKQTPKEKEDDPSQRGFDKEKDMGLGGRIGHVQKKDMIGRAADFGSRFQKGKYL